MTQRQQFAHVILFYCPSCKGPIACAFSSPNETLERLDNSEFAAKCRCGWSGSGLELMAVNESTQPWEAICEPPAADTSSSVDEYLAGADSWLHRVAREIASLSKKLKTQPASV